MIPRLGRVAMATLVLLLIVAPFGQVFARRGLRCQVLASLTGRLCAHFFRTHTQLAERRVLYNPSR